MMNIQRFRIECRTQGIHLPKEGEMRAIQALVHAIPNDWVMVVGEIRSPSFFNIAIAAMIGVEIRRNYHVEFLCPPGPDCAPLIPFLMKRERLAFIRFNETGLLTTGGIEPIRELIAEYLKEGYCGTLTFVGRMTADHPHAMSEWCRISIVRTVPLVERGPGFALHFNRSIVEIGFDAEYAGKEDRLEPIKSVITLFGMHQVKGDLLPLTRPK